MMVDKADAIEILGMLNITGEQLTRVYKTLAMAMDKAKQQSKDDMHPIKLEVNKVLQKLK
jgi:hypothetical protein